MVYFFPTTFEAGVEDNDLDIRMERTLKNWI